MPRSDPPDPLVREVDDLLGKLKSQPYGGSAVNVGTPKSRSGPSRPALVVGAARAEKEHAWGKVVLVASLGVALPFWPYASGCGGGLISYFAALGVLLITATWALSAAWRQRTAPAYGVGLALVVWGVGLGLTQILPRTGYAQTTAYWSCAAGMNPEPGVATEPLMAPASQEPSDLPHFF